MKIDWDKKKLVASGKCLLGLGLIIFLLSRVDLKALLNILVSVNLFYLAIVLILSHLSIFLSTVKWKYLLENLDIHGGLSRLFGLYLVGTFFNNFLPTMVGGDLMRSYALCREAKDHSSVIAATFMERLLGMAALVTLLPLILYQQAAIGRYPLLKYFVVIVILCFTGSVFLIFQKTNLFRNIKKRVNTWLAKIVMLTEKIQHRVHLFLQFKKTLLLSYGISIVFYFTVSGATWAATRSVGIEVDYFYILAIVPVVLLVASIPVSLNGLGITEAGYVIFLGLLGVPAVDALAAALILRGRVLFTAIIGGIIFMFYRPNRTNDHLSSSTITRR